MSEQRENPLILWQRILDQQFAESRDRADKSRAALVKFEETCKLDPRLEYVIEAVSRHNLDLMKLSGRTPPKNDEELALWLAELRRGREFLNSLVISDEAVAAMTWSDSE